ncbi:hypothetical protein LKM00_26375 [Bacillus wiedmannii]|uniref:hypothetical protein n=1 Tax=Bacillus wiedmannii TaxID=1890302 RepID=UPI001E43841D|nr:hypothetical protein [Bacillus wiedmannii]MCC2380927.1 hypothetical protein [Bacillus wiedmannii]MCC2425390.1 hypothetical protein [Bacillus wiedmannii]
MFDTIKTQQDNWQYVRELDIFKNDEEDVTFFHWIMKLDNLNVITNDKNEKATFDDLVKIGEMNEEKTKIFLDKLKEHGFILEIIIGTGNHFISNPNLAFKKFDEEWMLNFKEEFKKKEQNGALKDLPVDVWEADLSEY